MQNSGNTKYIVIVGDGMAGWPLDELGGRTTLQAASTPNMDRLASCSVVGMVRNVPEGYPPGSDVANLSIFGYDPAKYYTGRAPLEAASIGVPLEDGDIAYRCNFITIDTSDGYENGVMVDYCGGHITTEEARELIASIEEKLSTEAIRFYPGTSYRHLMVWRGGAFTAACTPPHDITGRPFSAYLPKGDGENVLRGLMRASVDVLADHPVNRARIAAGKRPANCIWLWGQGGRPAMPDFQAKYGKTGAIISAVDLTRGIGVFAGFEVIIVPGATGYIDTNYDGKVAATLSALERLDIVYLHVEAPDEAGHSGDMKIKLTAIEDFDRRIVGPVLDGLEKRFQRYRVLLLPDHPTPIKIKTHSSEPVPYILHTKGDGFKTARAYDEKLGEQPDARNVDDGFRLMDELLEV